MNYKKSLWTTGLALLAVVLFTAAETGKTALLVNTADVTIAMPSFVKNNLVNWDPWLVKRTNGTFVSGTIGGTLTIPSGAGVTAAPGSTISFDQLTISGTPSAATDAATKGMLDSTANIIFVTVPPAMVTDLNALANVSVTSVMARFGYVRNNTAGDGAAGLWIWDQNSTVAEGPVVKRSANLSPSDPGRWLKLL